MPADATERRLLSESKLKYVNAVELATTLETAAKNMKELTIATRQYVEGSKTYDIHKIEKARKKGDSMWATLITLQISVDSRM